MKKVTVLSTGKLTFFQIIITIFWLSIPGFFLIRWFLEKKNLFFNIGMALTYGVMSFNQIKRVLKLKVISHDDYYLYVTFDGYEQSIPLDEVSDIELKDVLGIHSIKLGPQHGNRIIYFKSSLWYPFNYVKVDNNIDRLQKKIDEARSRRADVKSHFALN